MPQFEDFDRNSLKSWNGEVLLPALSIKAYCYLVKEAISLVFYEEGGSSNNVSGKLMPCQNEPAVGRVTKLKQHLANYDN